MNDRETFTRRIKQGTDEHASNPTLQFMQENFRSVNGGRPVSRAPGSSRKPSGSMEVVPTKEWEDISVDDEITRPMSNLRLKTFPTRCQRYNGFTDIDDNITKLNKLTNHPDCFPLNHMIPSFRKSNYRLKLPGEKWTLKGMLTNWIWKIHITVVSLLAPKVLPGHKCIHAAFVDLKLIIPHSLLYWTVTVFHLQDSNQAQRSTWSLK